MLLRTTVLHRLPRFFGSGVAVWAWSDQPFTERPSRSPAPFGVWVGGGGSRWGCGWVCPYLENCTVDASIFVAKLLRAHGGCLGTRSR